MLTFHNPVALAAVCLIKQVRREIEKGENIETGIEGENESGSPQLSNLQYMYMTYTHDMMGNMRELTNIAIFFT